jgi:hypothetical protein
MAESGPSKRDTSYPAEKARGGEIILRRRWQRVVFIAGLAGAALLGLVLALWYR